MQKINSICQSPIYTKNYQSNGINYTPSFKQNTQIAHATIDTISKNKTNILKGIAAFLGSLGLLKVAKEVSKNPTEEEKTETEKFLESFESLKETRFNRGQKIDVKLDKLIKDTIKNVPIEAENIIKKELEHKESIFKELRKDKHDEYVTTEYFDKYDKKKHVIKARCYNAPDGHSGITNIEDRPIDSKSMWEPAVRISLHTYKTEKGNIDKETVAIQDLNNEKILQYKPYKVFYLKDGKGVRIKYDANTHKPEEIGFDIVRDNDAVETINIEIDPETQKPTEIRMIKDRKKFVMQFNDDYKENEVNHIDFDSLREQEEDMHWQDRLAYLHARSHQKEIDSIEDKIQYLEHYPGHILKSTLDEKIAAQRVKLHFLTDSDFNDPNSRFNRLPDPVFRPLPSL